MSMVIYYNDFETKDLLWTQEKNWIFHVNITPDSWYIRDVFRFNESQTLQEFETMWNKWHHIGRSREDDVNETFHRKCNDRAKFRRAVVFFAR